MEDVEVDKVNLQLLQETEKNNTINTELSTEHKLVFDNGNTYTYVLEDYTLYLNDNIKIAENIENITFEVIERSTMQKLNVSIITANAQTSRSFQYVIPTLESETEHNWARTGDELTCSNCGKQYTIGQTYRYRGSGSSSSIIISSEESGLTAYFIANGSSSTYPQTINKETLTWQVLGIDDEDKNGTYETLLITASQPMTTSFYLYGEYAYNNGIDIINRICQEFYGPNARGMKIEDINNCFQYSPAESWYISNSQYQAINGFDTYIDELSTWSAIIANGTKTPKNPTSNNQTNLEGYILNGYWYKVLSTSATTLTLPNNMNTGTITDVERNLIFGSSNEYGYILESRAVAANTAGNVSFTIGSVASGIAGFTGASLTSSGTRQLVSKNYIRPVVAIYK